MNNNNYFNMTINNNIKYCIYFKKYKTLIIVVYK